MANKAEYKNAIQTKMKIASSYLALKVENEDKFSVTDLVDLAEINRGTFYLHFKNLNDVETYIDNELGERFKPMELAFRQTDLTKSPEVVLDKLNEILSADLEYFKLIINASEKMSLIERIKNSILISISNNFEIIKYINDYNKFTLIIRYIVGGVVSTYTDWFKGLINCTLEDLSKNLGFMIKKALRGYIINEY